MFACFSTHVMFKGKLPCFFLQRIVSKYVIGDSLLWSWETRERNLPSSILFFAICIHWSLALCIQTFAWRILSPCQLERTLRGQWALSRPPGWSIRTKVFSTGFSFETKRIIYEAHWAKKTFRLSSYKFQTEGFSPARSFLSLCVPALLHRKPRLGHDPLF